MTIPPIIIALFSGLAGWSWILFARSQSGRKQAVALIWLSLPFFILSGIYLWFFLAQVEVDVRTTHARYGILAISVSQAVVLFILTFGNKVR